jgi:TonB family protein
MTRHIPHRQIAFLVGWLLAMSGTTAFAQDVLTRAKTFYASASYEEALAALTSLRGKASASESTEAALYEVFCLVALGRNDEAKKTIETMVKADPEYRLTDAEASPRVRTMFDVVRKPLLTGIVRESYTRGRDAFDRKDLPGALKEFDRVIALIGELDPSSDQGLRDMGTLATGFRDLARSVPVAPPPPAPSTPAVAAVEAPKPSQPAPPAAAAAPPPARVDPPVTFGSDDAGVRPPVAISQTLPPWRPETSVEKKLEFRGTIDLVIDEQGRVLSAAVVRSIHERFDAQLLDAARRWTYKPATKDGKPVRYRHTVMVNLRNN